MALIHRATLVPTKLELLTAWLPTRPWWTGSGTPELEQVGAYRFDDPAGEVGVETLVVRSGAGPLLQVPLTYRGAPVDEQAVALVGTVEHSVLGRRWVYDACSDPVYAAGLLRVVLTGGTGAAEEVDHGDRREARTPTVLVRGSGSPDATVPQVDGVRTDADSDPATVEAGGRQLVVARRLDRVLPGGPALTGTWAGQDEPVVLAVVR
ncbi:hypothetical protein CLV35_2257 [Motilibacter peucedani]|uniref:Maltokinase N-terminal cap domain-containing protein n=1 Tax=Motilibacter peucedani TaxID=598650 RepID=A0A420XNL0_9ACTN|nr:hypothetical protein [Motilibacter peucedani]RKS73766.1 hypothetical protein CLV35_2257 [Motilibacter peucedani]